MGFLSVLTEKHKHLDNPFDFLPDDVIRLIFNKVQDAKTLVASFSLNKHLASIIPQTDVVSLSLNLPGKQNYNNKKDYNSRRTRHNNNHIDNNTLNIAKFAANYLFTKLLRCSNNNSNNHDNGEGHYNPAIILCQRLRLFSQIKHLRIELHTNIGSIPNELLKWKANYGREFKSCHMLCCELSLRHFSPGELWSEPLPHDELYWELKQQKRSLSVCMKAAAERHQMVKHMLPLFPMLETVAITDVMRQGRFYMAEKDVRDLRESLKEEHIVEVGPRFIMRMWHAWLLELPSLRCTWKEAMMLVVDPVHSEPPMVPVLQVNGGGDGYECDAEERAIFEEAQREILTLGHGVTHQEWVTRRLLNVPYEFVL